MSVIGKVVASGISQSYDLLVTPDTFSLDDRETVGVVAEPLSSGGYRRYWLTRTTAGRLTIVGVLVVLAGQGIQTSLDVGTHWVLFDVGSTGNALLKAAKDITTLGGATLAAWQVILNS